MKINQLFETLEKKKLFGSNPFRSYKSHILLGDELPQCIGRDAPFTVRLFLLDCDDFSQIRYKYYQVDNMKQLFQDISVDNIMMF